MRAKLDGEARTAREHLKRIDPANERYAWALEERPPPDTEAAPDPSTILAPAQRQKALQGQRPPTTSWARHTYGAAMADTAEASGNVDTELDALEHLQKVASRADSNAHCARATARTGRDLREGARAADEAFGSLRDPRSYQLPYDGEEGPWRTSLTDALDARPLVAEARGHRATAADDLEEALLLVGPIPDRILRFGALQEGGRATPLLARARAELPDDDPRAASVLERLSTWLATRTGWQPGAATYVAASRPVVVGDEVPEPTLDASRFVDLTVQTDSEDVRLFAGSTSRAPSCWTCGRRGAARARSRSLTSTR